MLGCDDAGFADIQATALNAAISGSIFAVPEACLVMTMALIPAASFTPRNTRKWNAHIPTDEIRTAVRVLPCPKAGKDAPSVDLIRIQYETLPTQALAQ